MRLAAPACLAIALVVAGFSVSRADLRYYSSRVLDAGNNEFGIVFDEDRAGNFFLTANLLVQGALGGVTVGPGLVVVKLDATGDQVWARNLTLSYTSLNPPFAPGLAATHDGGVVVTGFFEGTADFGGGPMTAFGADIFLLKLDASGAVQWQGRYGYNQAQAGNAVAVDGDGDIVVIGDNWGAVDFGGGIIQTNGSSDAFVAKFDADGRHVWSRGVGSTDVQGVWGAIDFGSDNRLVISFRIEGGAIDLGAGLLFSHGQSDILAGVFDADGALLWSMHAGTTDNESAYGVAFDAGDNLLMCGVLTRPIDLGGGMLTPPATVPQEGFAAGYNPDGTHRWSYMINDAVLSGAYSLDADAFGNCFVIGRNEGSILVGLDEVPPSVALVLGFDPNGAPLFATGFNNVTLFVEVDRARDRIHLGGTLRGPVDFGGGELRPNGNDAVLVTMGVRRPPQVSITHFDARTIKAGIELAWNLASGEALGNYTVTRRIDAGPDEEWLHSAPARDGESSFIDTAPRPGHLNTYRLMVTTALGDDAFSEPVSVAVAPAITALEQNAPNPFNPVTTFVYSLAEPANVSIVIYDHSGALVARLDQGMQPAGRHRASWGGHNARGEFVASGVYFYRLEGVPDVGARKMVLLK